MNARRVRETSQDHVYESPTLAMLDRIAKAMHTTFTITVGEHAAS